MKNQESIKIWKLFLLYPIALIILFEEWGWGKLGGLFEYLEKNRCIKEIEHNLLSIPSWGVVLVFIVPILTFLPVKILAIYFLAKGDYILGIILIISSKIVGTAIFAKVFELTKPALLKIKFFARFYVPFKEWKDRLVCNIRNSRLWILIRKIRFL